MKADQLSQFRLVLQKDLLETQLKASTIRQELLEAAETQPTLLQDGMDHAREEGDLTTRLEIHSRQMGLNQKLVAALGRIRNGTFGQCFGCENQIDPRRLSAHPIATLCLKCQEKEERGISNQLMNPDLNIA